MYEIRVRQRVRQHGSWLPAKQPLHDGGHVGVGVYRKNQSNVGKLLEQVFHRQANLLKALTLVLAPVSRQQNDSSAKRAELRVSECRGPLQNLLQRVDNSIPG